MKRRGADRSVSDPGQQGYGSTYVENQLWQLLPPWLAAVGLFLLGGVAYLVWGSAGRAPWATAVLSASTVLLVLLTLTAGRARGGVVRLMGAVTVALGGVWLTSATVTGWGGPITWIYPLAAIPLCLGWNIRRLLRGTGEDAHGADAGYWADLKENVGVLRATIVEQRQAGLSQRATLKLPAGVPQSAVLGDGPALANVFETHPGGVTITPDPDNASQVEMTVVPSDVLKMGVPYRGPFALGQSIADAPLRLGDYQDAQLFTLWLPNCKADAERKIRAKVLSHILLGGITGAGKSEAIQTLVVAAAERYDVEIEYLDAGGKADQTIGPIRDAISRLSVEKAACAKHLSDLVGDIPARAAHLAAQGDEGRGWFKGCGLAFKVVILDEAADIVPDSDSFVEASRLLLSVGVQLVVALQDLTYNTLPTRARKNFGTRIALGCQTSSDAKIILPAEVREQGATPEAWANRRPGYAYVVDNGIDEQRYPIPVRFEWVQPDEARAAIAAALPFRQAAGIVALGAAAPAGAALVPDDSVTGEIVPDASASADGEDEMASEETQREAYRPPGGMADELAGVDPDADMKTDGLDLDQQIGEPRGRTLRPEQASAALDEMLAGFRQAKIREFQRADLIRAGALKRCDRGKSWLSGELGKRVTAGDLVDVTGDRADGLYGFADALAVAQSEVS